MPGNPVVLFRRWRFSPSRFYISHIHRLIKKHNVDVPKGYWNHDDKIRNVPRKRNYYRRERFKGFSDKFLPDSDGDEESEATVSTVIESESPPELAEALSRLSTQDSPLLCPLSEGDVFAMHLRRPASAVIEID